MIAALLLGEYSSYPFAGVPFAIDIPAIDRWLDTQPKPFAIAEVPVPSPGNLGALERHQTQSMLHATAHWQKTIHGYSNTWCLAAAYSLPSYVLLACRSAPGWSAQARLEPPDRGSDLAAVLRVRTQGPPRWPVQAHRCAWWSEYAWDSGRRCSIGHWSRGPWCPHWCSATPPRDADLTEDFRATGLTHLTAVSGANLTLLLAFCCSPPAGWVRGRWLRLVGLLGVVVFVGLCRTEPSVLRAAAMGLVALAALGAGGRGPGCATWRWRCSLLLLLDPFLAARSGFALSVLASGGIIWWARSWAACCAAGCR